MEGPKHLSPKILIINNNIVHFFSLFGAVFPGNNFHSSFSPLCLLGTRWVFPHFRLKTSLQSYWLVPEIHPIFHSLHPSFDFYWRLIQETNKLYLWLCHYITWCEEKMCNKKAKKKIIRRQSSLNNFVWCSFTSCWIILALTLGKAVT